MKNKDDKPKRPVGRPKTRPDFDPAIINIIGPCADPEEFMFKVMNCIADEVTTDHRLQAAKSLLVLKAKREGQTKVRMNHGLGKKQVQEQEAKDLFDSEKGGKFAQILSMRKMN